MTSLWSSGVRDDRRTLVVVFLRGGADGLALVPPIGDDAYHLARPTLGVRARDAIRLDDRFSLHPRLAPLAPLFHDGTLGVVHAVGSDDTTRSHFEAQDLMEHGGDGGGGWLGRFLRERNGAQPGALSAVALGEEFPESLRGAPSVTVMRSLDDFAVDHDDEPMLRALESLYDADTMALGGRLAPAARDTLAALRRLTQLRASPLRPRAGADYPADDFGRDLAQVARLIKGRVGVAVATVDLGGWDSHVAQGTLIEPLMERLARGLAAFHHDLGREALAGVTVVVMTEFGRRVAENASFGTDHGRGSMMLVLGDGAEGGRVRARWPGLESKLLDGPGDVPVTTDYREVLAPLLARHGARAVARIFPGWPGLPAVA
ncbi:MAG: DUF1501 domain-containing protein [Gemmatimonadaceae bacterium]|nr:DUF1501 domain-containing protein [Gemmatimonadaceae bacterium]